MEDIIYTSYTMSQVCRSSLFQISSKPSIEQGRGMNIKRHVPSQTGKEDEYDYRPSRGFAK